MAITADGLYGLTIEKMFIDTAGQSMEAETHKECLIPDASNTPNFDTDDFRNDVTESTGTGYTAGGVTCTGTEITLSAGVLTFDMVDTVYPTVTFAGAQAPMAGIFYFNVGTAATDQLIVLQDFVTSVTPTAANLTIQHSGTGVFTLTYA